jgi:holliday junction DNA helicase RuvA
MISFIKGRLSSIKDNSITIDCSGVGYEIFCTTIDIAKLSNQIEKDIIIYTHLIHKEDSMSLFGFIEEKTKKGFLTLLKVSGIGAKMAIKILSVYDKDFIFKAVENEDIKSLEMIPGIGAKMAKKIIFDLKGVLPAESDDYTSKEEKDLISAMLNLGYKENDIKSKIIQIKPLSDNFEENFKKLLKILAGK